VPGPSLEPIVAAGVQVLSLGRSSRAALSAWWPLISVLRDQRIDVLHTHKFGSNFWGTVIGRLAGVPVIIAHEHTWSYQGQLLRRFLDREVIARAAHVVLAVSREDRRRMIEIEHIDPDRIRFIPNGIPPKPLAHGAVVRAELGIPPEAPVIGTVGSLRPQKALPFLIECAALLTPDFPALRVLIVGDGSEETRIRSLIRTHDLGQTVILLGHRSDVPEIIAALDVAVSTSDWEGSPLSVMEYMAAGKPIVATRVGGVPDLVTNGVHGLLVERGDVRGLAQSIAELLRDAGLRAAMGARGRRRQRLEFDIDLMVRRLETLYEELFRVTERARSEHWAPGQARP
jgi:glycosyltransferase involved in cell wall biosynthesis